MQESPFETYMASRNLAERTRAQRVYALKRIERAYGVDLDAEFERDRLSDLLSTFAYTSADERTAAPNPSKLDIDLDKLLTHLRWYRSHLVDYVRFRSGHSDPVQLQSDEFHEETAVEALVEEIVGRTFALEKDLQAALRANLGQLEPGLVVADGGIERKVQAGFIDILGRDATGLLTVIELKAEITRPDSIAQILSYMGCVVEEMGEPVRGVLVGSDHHPRVVLASRAIPNLSLRKYRFRFDFE